MAAGVRRPTEEEVIKRLKDDGDFDALRLKIIRKVKENEELRASIVAEVKQSVVLNEDGSEKLKLRQLSDAIYQELGSKIMGQISDEVWKTIKSNENDIKGTVETVYNRIVNSEQPKKKESPSSSKKQLSGSEDQTSSIRSKSEAKVADANEPKEPPGFGSSANPGNREKFHGDHPRSSSGQEPDHMVQDDEDDAMPPGFGLGNDGATSLPSGASDEDLDVPPGFG